MLCGYGYLFRGLCSVSSEVLLMLMMMLVVLVVVVGVGVLVCMSRLFSVWFMCCFVLMRFSSVYSSSVVGMVS